jgi:hypothetical protein
MTENNPFELMIECGGCCLENLIPGFTLGDHAICNQCRENMLAFNLFETHQGHTCDSCGRVYLLKAETEFINGESECQCGGQHFTELDIKNFADKSAKAQQAALDDEEEDSKFDWCRPAPNNVNKEDYNEIFDDNPGFL